MTWNKLGKHIYNLQASREAKWYKIFVFKWQLFFWRINKQNLEVEKTKNHDHA